MNRRELFKTAAAGLTIGLPASVRGRPQAGQRTPPNLLFLISDQQRADEEQAELHDSERKQISNCALRHDLDQVSAILSRCVQIRIEPGMVDDERSMKIRSRPAKVRPEPVDTVSNTLPLSQLSQLYTARNGGM